jgi:hypothetical protein
MQRWFTDVAAQNDNAKEMVVVEDGKVAGSLPIVLVRNSLGMKQAYNLPWARVCGPNLPEDISKSKRTQITRQLIRQLPTDASYFLTLATEFDYGLFLSEGFQPALEDNYTVTPNLSAVLHASFSKMTRRDIRQAQEHLIVSTTTPRALIQGLCDRSCPQTPQVVCAAHDRARYSRGRCAPGSSPRLHRTRTRHRRNWRGDGVLVGRHQLFLLDDNASSSGRRTDPTPPGLLWSAIQDAASKGLTFDFGGIRSDFSLEKDGVTRLYEGMGAQRSVRYRVEARNQSRTISRPASHSDQTVDYEDRRHIHDAQNELLTIPRSLP